MFGRKSQKIRDLERLVRVRTGERDEAHGDYKAAHADVRSLAQQLATEQKTTRALRTRLAKSEQGRRNLLGLLAHHRDTGPYGQLTVIRTRLDRALRACARYRDAESKLARQNALLQNSYDHAVGLDSPAIEDGARWQERRPDKARGIVL